MSIIAEVRTYAELMSAIRRRLFDLDLSYETLDAIAGWTDTYATKLLAPDPAKHLGPMSFDLIFPALALKIGLIHDAEQLQRLRKHQNFRRRKLPPRNEPLSMPLSMTDLGRKGGLRRAMKISRRQRKAIARAAARARWGYRGAGTSARAAARSATAQPARTTGSAIAVSTAPAQRR